MIGRTRHYDADVDAEAKTLKLSEPGGSRAELTFDQPDPDRIHLDGWLDGRRTRATLRKAALLRD